MTDNANDQWIESLPEALRTAPFFKPGEDGTARTVDQVMSDLTNAAQHMGNSLRFPGPDAGVDDVTSFQGKVLEKVPGLMKVPDIDNADTMAGIYDSLGRPKSLDDYKAPEVEGHSWEGQDMGKMKARAHKLGMSQNQFNNMLSEMATDNMASKGIRETEQTEQMSGLKTEWGDTFDNRMDAVKQLINGDATPPEFKKAIEAGTLPANTLRWLYKMADSVGGEGGELKGQGKEQQGAITPNEAEAQISEIMNRPEYWDAASPQQKVLKAKVLDLAKMADPDARQSMDHLRA